MADLSPMMQQYFAIKAENPDTLLFFRLGDFYELFFDDAKVASKELDLTLTGRDCGQEERAPMCGVPAHSSENYIARLVGKGYKVAICEQMEDPATAKGLVQRDVVRVITPGTVLESTMLDETKNNYLASVYYQPENETAGLCFVDVSTGQVSITHCTGDVLPRLKEELVRFHPRELLMNPEVTSLTQLAPFLQESLSVSVECLEEDIYRKEDCTARLQTQYGRDAAEELGLQEETILFALGGLLYYLAQTQKSGLERLQKPQSYENAQFMHLDQNTIRNLELFETMRTKEKKGSLLWVLDKTRTAMGKRLLRTWLHRPLLHPTPITRRQEAVACLLENAIAQDDLREALSAMPDLERLMTKLVYGSAGGRDLRSLADALARLPSLRNTLAQCKAPLLQALWEKIDGLEDIVALIDAAIVDDPPFSIHEGGVIRHGYREELDQIKSDMQNGKALLTKLELEEREKTGIPKLKIGYNRVFGYYLEVSNAHKDKIPPEYIRKQTLSSCERFITPSLKELEGRILGARERSFQLEETLFQQVRGAVAEALSRVQATATALAELDVLCSFAKVSTTYHYVRPHMNLSGKILLQESRHPVVESLLKSGSFVANDVTLDLGDNRVAILTGPNMAGKSTYMRQVALIVLLAQIGCFVPCQSAEIGMVDGIYTRVGASDDLASGQSTFMVEMQEVAEILSSATRNSLLILDEIGRGTSTYDGMSIARAVLEYVANPKRLGAKALFATHYHELTVLEESLSGVKNYNVAVRKRGDDITFLRRILPGGADDSYGIAVAKLADVPQKVIDRAKEILAELEGGDHPLPQKPAAKAEETQLTFAPDYQREVLSKLKQADVNSMTPMEALNFLYELQHLVKQ